MCVFGGEYEGVMKCCGGQMDHDNVDHRDFRVCNIRAGPTGDTHQVYLSPGLHPSFFPWVN